MSGRFTSVNLCFNSEFKITIAPQKAKFTISYATKSLITSNFALDIYNIHSTVLGDIEEKAPQSMALLCFLLLFKT